MAPKTYMVTLLYNGQTPSRKSLTKALEEVATAVHRFGTFWIVKSHRTAREIRDVIEKETGTTGNFLVVRLYREAAWRHLPEETARFLKDQL